MLNRSALLLSLALLAGDACAENSIVIGQGIRVDEVFHDGGDWVSGYVWQVKARRTVSGPIVKGKIRVIAASHAQPSDGYLKTVQLFVLAPVAAGDAEKDAPKYSLIASSPLDGSGRYCVRFNPSEIGIRLSYAEVMKNERGAYCFSKAALLEAAK